MTNDQRSASTFSPRWGRAGLSIAALFFASLAPTAIAQDEDEEEATYTAIRAADNDTLTISASGRASLSLTRAPASSTGAKLHVVNSDNYSLWTGDLTKQGNNWVAQVDRAGVQAMLIANAIQAEFPDAATDDKDLRISLLSADLDGPLDAAYPLVGTEPLFYEAPETPDALEALEPNADAIRISSYAMAARRYDEQLSAYQQRLLAAKSNAIALWVDLKTSGRLPAWPASIISAQERAFAAIEAEANAITQQREEVRATARAAVDQWNAANSDAEPVEVPFRDMG